MGSMAFDNRIFTLSHVILFQLYHDDSLVQSRQNMLKTAAPDVGPFPANSFIQPAHGTIYSCPQFPMNTRVLVCAYINVRASVCPRSLSPLLNRRGPLWYCHFYVKLSSTLHCSFHQNHNLHLRRRDPGHTTLLLAQYRQYQQLVHIVERSRPDCTRQRILFSTLEITTICAHSGEILTRLHTASAGCAAFPNYLSNVC